MTKRVFVLAVAALVVVAGRARGDGLFYRSAGTSRWINIASNGDSKAAGFYAGQQFDGFAATIKASIDNAPAAVCGGGDDVIAAAFSAKFKPAATTPNTGLFFYEAVSGAIIDVAKEGDPTPIGGTWKSFKGINPAVAIDQWTCVTYIFFRGQAVGGPTTTTSDTGIFVATFGPPPGFAPLGVVALAQEGVTAAPAPFPGGSVLADFPAGLHLSASHMPAGGPADGGVFGAARVQAKGGTPKVAAGNDTGVMMLLTVGPSPVVMAREGDSVGCPPTWAGHGTAFDDFPPTLQVVTSVLFGGSPSAMYRSKSKGGATTSDTAIQIHTFASGCGSSFSDVIEGTGASGTGAGTYADFPPTTPLALNAFAGPVWLAKVNGGTTAKALFVAGFAASGFIARAGAEDSALGDGLVSLISDPAPAVSSTGDIIFGMKAGSYAGLFLANLYGPIVFPAELLTIGGRNPQIDGLGDITARFP